MEKEKIVIIGAGISGLYLAFLLETKYDVTILEARDRVGGRVFSIEGHDMGPSWIWRHHQNMIDLVYKFGLELFYQFTDGYALYDTQNKVEKFIPQEVIPSARVDGTLYALINNIKQRLVSTKIILEEEVSSICNLGDSIEVKTEKNEYSADYVISTLPPRVATNLLFRPNLPKVLQMQMENTHTWMGNSIKCVIEFKKSFWKDMGLSGFMFSNLGPIGEMHDASTKTKAALFGFVHSNVDTSNKQQFRKSVKEQMIRVFHIKEDEIVQIYFVDWRDEKYTSTALDRQPLSTHPNYGIDTSSYSDKILFSSTEFSFNEGGYLEGAIIRATKIAKQLLHNA